MAIAQARKRAGLRQRQVAKALGVSPSAVSMWDTGARMPRADTLVKLAVLYGCTVDEFGMPAETEKDLSAIRAKYMPGLEQLAGADE